MRRRVAHLAAFALPLFVAPLSATAQDGRTVVVVLDRSASLRHGDPDGRGPRLLATALALAASAGDRIAIYPTGGEPTPPGQVTGETASLAPLLRTLLATRPAPGGADLPDVLSAAVEVAGEGGLVLVYTDDDLDVVDAEGQFPAAVREALEATPNPTRADVNRAAAELIRALASSAQSVRFVGLRAPLPPPARLTPLLAELKAEVVELGGDDLEVVAQLAAAVRGDPIVSHEVTLERGAAALELPYPARVVVRSTASFRIQGGEALDGDGGRVWVADVRGPLAVSAATQPLRCMVSPRLAFAGELLAYGLNNGDVRVVAVGSGASPGGEGGRVIFRHGRERVALDGSPPAATLHLGVLPERVEVIRELTEVPGEAVVAARRLISVTPAEVELTAKGSPRVGEILELRGILPRGLEIDALPIEVREGSGASRKLLLRIEGGALVARLTPQSAGRLELRSQGLIGLRLPTPIVVAPGERRLLAIESLTAGGVELGRLERLRLRSLSAKLDVIVTVTPAPPAPLAVRLSLLGAPDGASLEAGDSLTVSDRRAVSVTLRWPEGADPEQITLRCEALAGTATPATRSFVVDPPPSFGRRLAAGAFLALALLWGGWTLRKRRKRARYIEAVVGARQLRTVGANGRLSHERYRLRDFVGRSLDIVVEPEDSPGGALEFTIRADGSVSCKGTGGAKLVHADRPAVLANSAVLRHGTPFAMVCGQRALRYVYLDAEPTAEDLNGIYLADTASYDELAAQDSGIYLLLDEDDVNVPRCSARIDASRELFPAPSSEELFDSSGEVAVVPSSDPDADLILSDEGLVIMDSAEGAIMDSDEVEFLSQSSAPELRALDDSGDEGRGDGAISYDDLYD